MHAALRIISLIILSLVLHFLLGWEWTIIAGVAAGLWFSTSGWLLGGVAVGAGWLLLVAYNYVIDARAIGVMTETVGSIMGNLPGWAVVGITLLMGLAIGVLGGAAGSQIRKLVHKVRSPTTHISSSTFHVL